MNPDFAIVLNFNLKEQKNVDPDFLVKTARNIGARAVSGFDGLKKACQKYTIKYLPDLTSVNLTAENVIDTIVKNRQLSQNTVIGLDVTSDGSFSKNDQALLNTLNHWMHLYGHALNDSRKSQLTTDEPNFVLENSHASYQKYVFLKAPLSDKVVIENLAQEPNRVEWIANREELPFEFKDGKLTIKLEQVNTDEIWQIVRIQAHRPEDDWGETKF